MASFSFIFSWPQASLGPMKSHRKNPDCHVPFRLGILGGGQLARMMALETHRMGIEPWVLSENADDPAAQVTRFWVKGNPQNAADLTSFFQKVDTLTFESEFLNADLLARIQKTENKTIWPEPQLMGTLQDRLSQKNLLIAHHIPTADFIEVHGQAQYQKARDLFPDGFVLKKRRGGYDGYGTYIIRSDRQFEEFKSVLDTEKSGFIAEAWVPFKRELAVILGRDQNGNDFELPLVESKQTHAKCDWVMGPIRHTKAKSLIKKIQKMLLEVNYVGVIGFELFDTGKTLLVNELAPRVHNSGHYSQNALSESQFALHVKAVCGIECTSPVLLNKAFAMANLVGASENPISWKGNFASRLHWYGKKQNRQGRKMGHLNFAANTGKEALSQVLKDRKKFTL